MIIRIRGSFEIESYYALDGSICPVETCQKKGDTVVTLTIYGEDSLLWKLIPVKAETTASLHRKKEKPSGSFAIKTGINHGTYGLVAAAPPRNSDTCRKKNLLTIYEPESYLLEEQMFCFLINAAGDWMEQSGSQSRKFSDWIIRFAPFFIFHIVRMLIHSLGESRMLRKIMWWNCSMSFIQR